MEVRAHSGKENYTLNCVGSDVFLLLTLLLSVVQLGGFIALLLDWLVLSHISILENIFRKEVLVSQCTPSLSVVLRGGTAIFGQFLSYQMGL